MSNETAEHEDHHQVANREWFNHFPKYDVLRNVVNGIRSVESEERLLQSLQEACQVNANVIEVVCIDEGIETTERDDQKVYQLGIGGSGILLPETELVAFVDYLADLHRQGKEVNITSHGSCGAAARSSGAHEEDEVVEAAQTFGEKLAQVLAEKTGEAITHRFIPVENMARPKHVHNAFGAFIDTTGRFNPTRKSNTYTSEELPPMFNIAATYDNVQHVVDNVAVAFDIATGGHGFGDRFTQEQPFLVCLVIDKQEDQVKEDQLHEALLARFGQEKRLAIRLLDVSQVAETTPATATASD